MTINFEDTFIKLKQNHQIVLNGDELTKLPTLFNSIRIRVVSSIFIAVHLPNGLEVWWDGVSSVYINIPAEFYGKFLFSFDLFSKSHWTENSLKEVF